MGGRELYSIRSTLQGVDTEVSYTDQRVDRIASVLPDLGIRISAEEVSRSIQCAIVSTKPFQNQDGKWTKRFYLIDPDNAKKIAYTCRLSKEDDRSTVYALLGVGRDLEPQFSSGLEMLVWCATAKEPASFPGFIDASAPMFFHSTTAKTLKPTLFSLGPSEETAFEYPPSDGKTLIRIVMLKQNEFGAKRCQDDYLNREG